MAPVLTLSSNDDLSRQNVVGTYDPDTQCAHLRGHDLGAQKGTILLRTPGGEALYPAIADWENETIRLDMDSTQP
jgi:hypothetical protein